MIARGSRDCAAIVKPAGARIDGASLLRHVYLEDVLACPCGSRRRTIADVEEPSAIEAILSHLGLPTTAPLTLTPPAPPMRPRAHLRPRDGARHAHAPTRTHRGERKPRRPRPRRPSWRSWRGIAWPLLSSASYRTRASISASWRGFQSGDFGFAVDAVFFARPWGAQSVGFSGSASLGLPFGVTMMRLGEAGVDHAFTFGSMTASKPGTFAF